MTLRIEKPKGEFFMSNYTHQTAPTQFVEAGTDTIIKIVDHWTLRDGQAISLWAAYFEPQAVLEKLGIKHCFGR
jgi:hypothetical protein